MVLANVFDISHDHMVVHGRRVLCGEAGDDDGADLEHQFVTVSSSDDSASEGENDNGDGRGAAGAPAGGAGDAAAAGRPASAGDAAGVTADPSLRWRKVAGADAVTDATHDATAASGTPADRDTAADVGEPESEAEALE